jgi:hypothetical protein
MELLYASSSRCRDTNLGVFSPPLQFAPLVFFFLPRICLSFWSLFFCLLSTLSLFLFLSFSFLFLPLFSPVFFLPFCFSAILIFSMVLFVSLETSLPCQYLLLLCNISLRSFTVFSSLFFPLFFFFSPPSLCFRSFFSPPLSLQNFRPRAALVPRIYRQEERAATLSLPNPRDRVGWLRRLYVVVSAARRVWFPCPIFIMVAGEGRGLCQGLCKWGGR